ncbi:MAG: TetR/AcrR family transcriptional regulator [Bdellovibrio sp.]|nr:TetR/AcrR family transcriptional regulator [Bdellovibrio sp.]
MDDTSQQKKGAGSSLSRSKAKKRDRSASEERLLKAAEDVFSKYGFKGSTTRMIADKAKVNESLIGRYFDGKMGLLFSLIERHMEEHPLNQLSYPAQGNIKDELTMLINSMVSEHCNKNEEFFKIVLSQCLVDAKFLKRIREAKPMKILPEVKERLESLRDQGKIRKDIDLDMFVENLDTYFHGVMFFDGVLQELPMEKLKSKLNFFVTTVSAYLEMKA